MVRHDGTPASSVLPERSAFIRERLKFRYHPAMRHLNRAEEGERILREYAGNGFPEMMAMLERMKAS